MFAASPEHFKACRPGAPPGRNSWSGSVATCRVRSRARSASSAAPPSHTGSRVRWPPPRSPRPSAHRPATTPPPTRTRSAGPTGSTTAGRRSTRLVVANLFAFRSVAIEFGPAELIDSIAIRPLAYYFGPMLFGNVVGRLDLRKVGLRHRVLRSRHLQLRAVQGSAGGAPHRVSRRSTVNPSLRSQLRDTLRARSDTEGWRALIAQHGTPLLVLDPYRVVEQCRLLESHLRGFGLHYAVKTSPHPAVLRAVAASGCGFDVATQGRDRSHWRAWPSHRPVHQHQPGQEAHRHRPRLHRRCPHLRRRQSDRGPEVRGPARRHRGPGAAGVPQPVGEVGSVDEVRRRSRPTRNSSSSMCWPPGCDSRASAFTSAAREQPSSRTGDALRGTLELVAHIDETLGVRNRIIDIGGGFPVSYREAMPPIDAIAAVVDEVLGDRRDEFTLLAEPGRFLAADCMTLLTSVVGSAVRDGRDVALPRRRALRQLLERDDRGRAPADPRDARDRRRREADTSR